LSHALPGGPPMARGTTELTVPAGIDPGRAKGDFGVFEAPRHPRSSAARFSFTPLQCSASGIGGFLWVTLGHLFASSALSPT